MASIPPIRQIAPEDFPEQSEWIDKLITPINQFFEASVSAFSQGLTIRENFAGDLKDVDIDGTFPVRVAWGLRQKPTSVLVGQCVRADGATFAQTRAVQVQWTHNQNGQLQINNVVGLLPPAAAFVDSAVNTGTDAILLPLHELTTGQKVLLASSGALPAGLSAGIYYIIRTDDFHVKLASTYANALAKTAVDITAAAGGGYHTITPQYNVKFRLTLECKTG